MTDHHNGQAGDTRTAEEVLAAEKAARKRKARAEVISWFRWLAGALVAALLVRFFIFTPAFVDGPSMLDTLRTGEIMAVLRFSYWFEGPQRGDIVFCRYPGWTEDCVKRVVALPGESIRIEGDIVYIDGEPLDEPYLTRPETRDFPETLVGENCYFVMGDNRGNSTDSRMVGALEKGQIEGNCAAVFWPLNQIKAL